MFPSSALRVATASLALFIVGLASVATAQGPPDSPAGQRRGFGRGPGGGPGGGRGFRGGRGPGGRGADARHAEDHDVFHFLLENHDKVRRTVKEVPGGVETLTESDDPKVAAKIQEHVKWMKHRVENAQPIHMRDPLFAEVFRNADKINMSYKKTEKGVVVTETSKDAYVAQLIREHAKVVSAFVKRGHAEAMANHEAPKKTAASPSKPSVPLVGPAIADFGKVATLPDAAHQPRNGSKILVDVTKGGDPAKLNPAIEKVARFVNIYEGAGAKPAKASIAVVLHGDATLAILNPEAYTERFGGNKNPNLTCLKEIQKHGVQIFVCGQSLLHKGGKPEEVLEFVDVAVSGLSAMVNLQQDGYGYIPLK